MTFVSYAQNFEDVMLWRALKHIEEGFYIDIGAQDPVVDSVSLAFYENGWRGVHVEPSKQYSNKLRQARPDEIVEEVAVGNGDGPSIFYEFQGTGLSTLDPKNAQKHKESGFSCIESIVSMISLDALFERIGQRTIHWMKLDVEGFEKSILESWKESKARPWVVVVECTKAMSREENYGEWEDLVLSKGYGFAYFDGLNRFYVYSEQSHLLSAFRSPPNIFDKFLLSGKATHSFYELLEAKTQKAGARARGLEAEWASAKEKIGALTHQNGVLEVELAQAQNAKGELHSELAQTREQLEKALVYGDQSAHKLKTVYASWSWRITWPFRKLLDVFKRAYQVPFFLVMWVLPVPKRFTSRIVAIAMKRDYLRVRLLERINKYPSLKAHLDTFGRENVHQHKNINCINNTQTYERINKYKNEYSYYWQIDINLWSDYLIKRYKDLCRNSHKKYDNTKKHLVIHITLDTDISYELENKDIEYYVNTLIQKLRKDIDITIIGELFDEKYTNRNVIVSNVVNMKNIIKNEDYVIFIKYGDDINENIIKILKIYNTFDKEIILFDFYFYNEEYSFPVLLHGVDSVNGIYCDYFYSRFIIKGETLLKLLSMNMLKDQEFLNDPLHDSIPKNITKSDSNEYICCNPYDIVKQLFLSTEFSELNKTDKVLHIDFPLIKAGYENLPTKKNRNKMIKENIKNTTDIINTESSVLTKNKDMVSVVICSKNNSHCLESLINSLNLEKSIKEIIIVSNQTTYDYGREYLNTIKENKKISVEYYNDVFNFSKQSNIGAQNTNGKYILFLNDDICGFNRHWLDIMTNTAQKFQQSIVGPLLLYPDQNIQHAGMYLGFRNCAGHQYRGVGVYDKSLGISLLAPKQVSCLTGAALMIERELFSDLNGFDPLLGTFLQDVDICLRAVERGVKLILEPRSIMFHLESISLSFSLNNENMNRIRGYEHDYFINRWGEKISKNDKWLNPLIDVKDETLRTLLI